MDTENNVESNPILPEGPQKTSDFYNVSPNLPTRFNNPECFHGYRFHGAFRKFSTHMQKSGMFRDNGFNTSPDKSRVIGPDHVAVFHDRVNFQHCYKNQASGPAV